MVVTSTPSPMRRNALVAVAVAALLTTATVSPTAARAADLSDHDAVNARYAHLHGLKPTRHMSVDELDAILGADDDEAREAERELEAHARLQRMAAHIEDEAARSTAAAAQAAAEEAERKRIARVQECVLPFGDVLGTANGVTAYSNCNELTIVDELETTMWTPPFTGKIGPGASAPPPVSIVTGLKWQCVEYSRRYMLINQGVVFGDVEGASDMWMLPFVSTPLNAQQPTGIATQGLTTSAVPHKGGRFRMDRYRSFAPSTATAWPEMGDHVIYRVQRDMPFGHTAVVVAVERNGDLEPSATEDDRKTIRVATIRIAEQNFGTLWADQTHSRVVELHRRGGTSFEASGRVVGLVDPAGYVPIGWLRARPEHAYTGPDLHTGLGEEPAAVGETVSADGAVLLRRR